MAKLTFGQNSVIIYKISDHARASLKEGQTLKTLLNFMP